MIGRLACSAGLKFGFSFTRLILLNHFLNSRELGLALAVPAVDCVGGGAALVQIRANIRLDPAVLTTVLHFCRGLVLMGGSKHDKTCSFMAKIPEEKNEKKPTKNSKEFKQGSPDFLPSLSPPRARPVGASRTSLSTPF